MIISNRVTRGWRRLLPLGVCDPEASSADLLLRSAAFPSESRSFQIRARRSNGRGTGRCADRRGVPAPPHGSRRTAASSTRAVRGKPCFWRRRDTAIIYAPAGVHASRKAADLQKQVRATNLRFATRFGLLAPESQTATGGSLRQPRDASRPL